MFKVIKSELTEEELALLSEQLADMLKNRKEINTDSWPDITAEKKVLDHLTFTVQAHVKIGFLIYERPGVERGRVHVGLEGLTKNFEFTNFEPFDPTLKGKEVQNLRKVLMEIFQYTVNLQKAKYRRDFAWYSWLMKSARFS